ncbi:MAG: CvpA family protein [Pseudomonadales bacterium]|nr:CvpA family protein [Pseudomonadales bacterium]
MNTADFVIIAIIGLSSLMSIRRGFTIEAISLASWVAAFVIGRLFSSPLAHLLRDVVDPPSAREPLAFVALLIATLVVASLIKKLFKEIVSASGLSVMDRVLGMGFGALRGIIIVVLVLGVLARLFEMNNDP